MLYDAYDREIPAPAKHFGFVPSTPTEAPAELAHPDATPAYAVATVWLEHDDEDEEEDEDQDEE